MKIEHNSQYYVQNASLGIKSKIHSEKDTTQIFSGGVAREFDEITNNTLESSPLSHFVRVNNNMNNLL